jgi:hypothetical protein
MIQMRNREGCKWGEGEEATTHLVGVGFEDFVDHLFEEGLLGVGREVVQFLFVGQLAPLDVLLRYLLGHRKRDLCSATASAVMSYGPGVEGGSGGKERNRGS